MNILKTLPPRAMPFLPPRSSKILNYGQDATDTSNLLVSVKRDEVTLTGPDGSSQRLNEVFDGNCNGSKFLKVDYPTALLLNGNSTTQILSKLSNTGLDIEPIEVTPKPLFFTVPTTIQIGPR